MKRFVLAATAAALLLAPAAVAADRLSDQAAPQRHRTIVVRGTAIAISPVSVRASIGSIVTCAVRDRSLVAGLSVGGHVRMACAAVNGRLVLRRLAIREEPSSRPTADGTARAVPVRVARGGPES